MNELSGISKLGDARNFLESFNWTDDALRDLEAVNTDKIHIHICGQFPVRIMHAML